MRLFCLARLIIILVTLNMLFFSRKLNLERTSITRLATITEDLSVRYKLTLLRPFPFWSFPSFSYREECQFMVVSCLLPPGSRLYPSSPSDPPVPGHLN
ncbi:hypothetical protein QL093DRAFT_1248366 [Fusarium oxysporum]|nr:hypothetical protein QL093DRAFT_1248366 [Fusarium oxysporum]